MKFKKTWKSASDYGEVYDVELLGHYKSYYSSGHLMSEDIRVRFSNGFEASIETWKVEIIEATKEENDMLENAIIKKY